VTDVDKPMDLHITKLYERAQETGNYHLFTFDIVNSKNMPNRAEAQTKLIKLSKLIYLDLKILEKETGKKIIADEWEEKYEAFSYGVRTYQQDPFILGDSLSFAIYRDSLTKEKVMDVFNIHKNNLDIDFDFHVKDGYYETNEWHEGLEKFCRSDAIKYFTTWHKFDYKTLEKKM
jgi:hypothetical protein